MLMKIGTLESQTVRLLCQIVTNWNNCTIRGQPFEKIVATNHHRLPVLLSACMEILLVLIKAKQEAFFQQNFQTVEGLVAQCFKLAQEDSRLSKGVLREFVVHASDLSSLASSLLLHLEGAVVDITHEMKKHTLHRAGESSSRQSRSRIRAASSDSSIEFSLFAVELIRELCMKRKDNLKVVAGSLLILANFLAKNHLLEAAAKQRHGSSLPPRTSSSDVRHHTPSFGILEAACYFDPIEFSRPPQLRSSRRAKDQLELAPSLQTILIILEMFESSEIVYHLIQNRKMLLQILGGILDTSDCLELQLVASRIISKLLLKSKVGVPFTRKEQSSFLSKLILFDFCSLPDDAAAQPLADLIALFAQKYLAKYPETHESGLLMACLLNAKEETRSKLWSQHFSGSNSLNSQNSLAGFQKVLQSDFEGLGGRFWVTLLVDILMQLLSTSASECLESMRVLAHGDVVTTQKLLQLLLPLFWIKLPGDRERIQLQSSIEFLLSRPFHSQFLRDGSFELLDQHSMNSVRTFVNAVASFKPVPSIDASLLAYLAENYNCWHEALLILEQQHLESLSGVHGEHALTAIRHCYRLLGEKNICLSLARESCFLPLSRSALAYDTYGMAVLAADSYMELVRLVEENTSLSVEPTEFEMDLWEERWVQLQKDLCQQEVVTAFALDANNPRLLLECAWKAQDFVELKTLLQRPLPLKESGDPEFKIVETLLAVAEGKLSEIENLHAQTAQLCLYRWQLLPLLGSGSSSHSTLLHFFHRLVELRESGQIMVESSNHSNGRSLPDLKNLLSAWRHRLPNEFESLSVWR